MKLIKSIVKNGWSFFAVIALTIAAKTLRGGRKMLVPIMYDIILHSGLAKYSLFPIWVKIQIEVETEKDESAIVDIITRYIRLQQRTTNADEESFVFNQSVLRGKHKGYEEKLTHSPTRFNFIKDEVIGVNLASAGNGKRGILVLRRYIIYDTELAEQIGIKDTRRSLTLKSEIPEISLIDITGTEPTIPGTRKVTARTTQIKPAPKVPHTDLYEEASQELLLQKTPQELFSIKIPGMLPIIAATIPKAPKGTIWEKPNKKTGLHHKLTPLEITAQSLTWKMIREILDDLYMPRDHRDIPTEVRIRIEQDLGYKPIALWPRHEDQTPFPPPFTEWKEVQGFAYWALVPENIKN